MNNNDFVIIIKKFRSIDVECSPTLDARALLLSRANPAGYNVVPNLGSTDFFNFLALKLII